VEHNGGNVWLDVLAPPWPKHSCFDTTPVSSVPISFNTTPVPIAPITLKVNDKGAISLCGLDHFPVTLHKEQWIKLLSQSEHIKHFIRSNTSRLKRIGFRYRSPRCFGLAPE
jgi:hypothetical protein